MEHHSNIVPWQLVCEQTGAVLKVIPVQDNSELDMAAFEGLLGERTPAAGDHPRVQRASARSIPWPR